MQPTPIANKFKVGLPCWTFRWGPPRYEEGICVLDSPRDATKFTLTA